MASVCASLYFCAGCTGEATGACFNPTLGIVNTTFVALVRKGTNLPTFLNYLPSYLFGPLIGATIAAIVTKYCIKPLVPNYYDELRDRIKGSILQVN